LLVGIGLRRKGSNAWLEKVPRFAFQKITVPYTSDPVDSTQLYASTHEIKEPINGKSLGNIPSWLNGSLLKNGPGLFEFGNGEEVKHIFDGMAMISKTSVTKSKNLTSAAISRKFIDSGILQRSLDQKKHGGLGSFYVPPEWTAFDRLSALIREDMADNSLVAIISLFGHHYATSELPIIHEFNPNTLETIGVVDLAKLVPALKDLKTMTPHPLLESDGTLWNMGMMANSNGIQAAIIKVPPPETDEEKQNPWLKAQLVSAIPTSRGFSFPYFHSFFMTPNYIIYPEQPYIIGDLFKTLWEFVIKGNPFMDSMYWDENALTSFRVVEKATGKLLPIIYNTEPMAYFHIINAYEDQGHLIVDAPFNAAASYDFMRMDILKLKGKELSDFVYKSNKENPRGCMRFALPLKAPKYENAIKKLKSIEGAKTYLVDASTVYLHPEYLAPPDHISALRYEFPAVNPQFQGQKYNSAYGIEFGRGILHGSGIVKLDLNKRQFVKKWEGSDCYSSEPLFIPRPGSTEEDDGVVVVTCINPNKSAPETNMVVLSPDLEELGRTQHKNIITPASFHGAWVKHL